MRQQMVDMYKQVSDATAFVRGDGSRLHSLKALEVALYTMNDGEFNHHVNSNRNDFSSWVLHVFGQKELAHSLAKSKSRVEMLSVLDEASRESTSAKSTTFIGALASKAAAQEKQPLPIASANAKVALPASASKVAQSSGHTAPQVKSTKSFHHKLKGMFRKGEHPVSKHNVQTYQAALATAKSVGHAADVTSLSDVASHVGTPKRTIHEQINHLDAQLAHMTRHHAHATARENVGSSILEESVKERILDFSLGLIVGLMLGFILAKSLGL